MTNGKFTVSGMTCAACQANVTKTVARLEGVKNADVNLLTGKMAVEFDESVVSSQDIINSVNSIGYSAQQDLPRQSRSDSNKSQWQSRRNNAENEQKSMKARLIVSVIILIPLMYIAMGGMAGLPLPKILNAEMYPLISAFTQLLLTVPVIFANKKFFVSGFKALFKGVPNMDSLVAIGSGASLLYGIFALYRMLYAQSVMNHQILHAYAHSLYFESSAMILTLVTVGKYLESRSKSKTSQTLEKLVSLAPKTARVIRNGEEQTILTEQIIVGDTVVIRPGESIPVDGVVSLGSGFVDQSAITGESIPVEKNIGDSVICATVNKNGSFNFTAQKIGDDTTLSQIIKMVDEAGSTKAPIARLADKISGIFVPIVIGIALVSAIVWLILGKDFEFALNCAVSVLVISCPCALGLATPVAIMVGTGKAAEMGILVKSAQSLEALHSINTVVLDKTGTVTKGEPSVTDIQAFGINENELLSIAASLESGSEHPLGEAIVNYANSKKISLKQAEDFTAVSGRGVSAEIEGKMYYGGNSAFMKEKGIEVIKNDADSLSSQGKTPLFFAKENQLLGIIAVADTVKSTSKPAIDEFKKMGLEVVLLTGDNALCAQATGKALGIENIISDVLPANKEECIASLQKQGKKVAMIGDGINDAPALTRADIGIAIGAGTDIAVEAADIVLIKSSLWDGVNAVKLSRGVIKNIKMNLFWAFFYNALGIPLAAGIFYPVFGILLSPMIGSLAMSLSSLCVVTNALRLRRFKYKTLNEEEKINQNKGEITMTKTLTIEGMMCEHCKAHVQNALQALSFVKEVEVSLENKTATVTVSDNFSCDELKSAVKNAGYEVTECK